MAARKKDAVSTERIELRAPTEWTERVAAVADRYGLSISAYIRLAVTERMERDEQQAGAPRRGRRKGE